MFKPTKITSSSPQFLQEISEIAGEEAALAIAHARGGRTSYIPSGVREGHWLPELVGLEAAQKISAAYGNERIEVPMLGRGLTEAEVRAAFAEHPTIASAATALGVHRRTISNWRRQLRLIDAGAGE